MGYKFTNRTELDSAIVEWINGEGSATARYGNINNWDVTSITDFSELFQLFF